LFHIDGIGVDVKRFHPVLTAEKKQIRESWGFHGTDFIVLYIAEFIPRKNHAFLLRQLPVLWQSIPEIKLLFAGKGELVEACKEVVAKLKMTEIVHFLGYRNDVELLYRIADVYVTPSKQEGLAISNLEAMASGLPIICSKIRGHWGVVTEGRNGFFFELNEPDRMIDLIITMYKSPELRETIARYNVADIQKFSIDTAIKKMAEIYKQFM
jgi:glycosyltransferase EpsD